MKYYKRYCYKKDTPEYPKGWELKFRAVDERYYPYKKSEWRHDNGGPSIYLDVDHKGYSLEEIKSVEWFEPKGKEVDYIPKFPNKENISEFLHLNLETKLVDDVDECRAMNALFRSEKFEEKLYHFVKTEYEIFHRLNKN